MSKTIESLRRFPSKDDILHDHIADTYFYQKNRPASKKKTKAPAVKLKINWAAAAFFLAILLLIAASPIIYRYHLNALMKRVASMKEVAILEDGHLNKLAVKNFAFRGYAKNKSHYADKYITLTNSRKYNWADMSADFKFPIDLSRASFSLSLKGSIGGEKVILVLRDTNNRSSRLEDIYLTSSWKTSTINLAEARNDLDISKITHIRLECGYIGESGKELNSPIDFTIYVKDLKILKED